jgi:hypothetical protein
VPGNICRRQAANSNVQMMTDATDAGGRALEPMGAISGRVMGSYAHVIA